MADVLMICEPQRNTYPDSESGTPFSTAFLSMDEFLRREAWYRPYYETLWTFFHTRSKYAQIEKLACWIAIALKDGVYVSSALAVVVGEKWDIEYVMTDPLAHDHGGGTAAMFRMMSEARERGCRWAILNCNPEKNEGKLPKFYAKFGFRLWNPEP